MKFLFSLIKKIPFQIISFLFIIVFFLGLAYIVTAFQDSLYKYLVFIILLYFIIAIILISLGVWLDRKLHDRPRIYPTGAIDLSFINYVKNNKFIKRLENKNITLLCEDYRPDEYQEKLYIRCINKKNNTFFTITGDTNLVSTIWFIFQREFNPNFTYDGLKFWYGECEFTFLDDIKLKETKQ